MRSRGTTLLRWLLTKPTSKTAPQEWSVVTAGRFNGRTRRNLSTLCASPAQLRNHFHNPVSCPLSPTRAL